MPKPPTIRLCPGEEDLAWGHFVLHAARGSFSAPGWATSALLRSVSDRTSVSVEGIDDSHLDQAVALLPEDPTELLVQLGELAGIGVPALGGAMRLDDALVKGLQRKEVPPIDLLHDAFQVFLASYGREGLQAALEGIGEPRSYDARSAIVVMLYALLLAGEDLD